MPQTSSSTPLVSLDCVSLDTETTGPDPAKARIVQIAAVAYQGPKPRDIRPFDTLVNPGVPIPAEATNIHGITDADVANAPSFADIREELEAFLGRSVLLGYHIGFDLTVLGREYAQLGLAWTPPRALDVRLLARLVQPMLANHNLGTVCHWLGIEIKKRHSALGDAMATAEVFAALVPRLRERGIRTLAEAEAACRRFSDEVVAHETAGWQAPVRTAPTDGDIPPAMTRIDSYPYRHRVREVMSSPPIFVAKTDSIQQALDVMVSENISSVFVGEAEGEAGIVTERDILRALTGDCGKAKQRPVSDIMSAPLQTVPESAFLYRAIGRLERLGFRHLGVTGRDGKIVGALTTRDLLRQRASSAIALGDEIDRAPDSAALGVAWAKLPMVARSLLAEAVDPRDIATVISREIRAMTRRAAELAVLEMEKKGHGAPPCPFAVLVLGSAGRGESLLGADQDNALVFETGEPGGDTDRWFEAMATIMSAILDEVGIPHCKGGVMAKNALWRHSLAEWKKTIDDWIRKSRPEDILNVDIFFDGRPVYGDMALGDEIWSHAYRRGHASPGFLKIMSEAMRDWRPPLTFLGRFRTQQGRVNLKNGGLMPLFTGARILSLRHDVRARATPERLKGLREKGIGSPEDLDNLIEAHRVLLGAILEQQLRDSETGIPLSNSVEVKRLSRKQSEEIRQALKMVDVMQGLVHGALSELIF